MIEPYWVGVHSTKEPFDDSELDHATYVDRVRFDLVLFRPGGDGETRSEGGVEGEECGEGDAGSVACAGVGVLFTLGAKVGGAVFVFFTVLGYVGDTRKSGVGV